MRLEFFQLLKKCDDILSMGKTQEKRKDDFKKSLTNCLFDGETQRKSKLMLLLLALILNGLMDKRGSRGK